MPFWGRQWVGDLRAVEVLAEKLSQNAQQRLLLKKTVHIITVTVTVSQSDARFLLPFFPPLIPLLTKEPTDGVWNGRGHPKFGPRWLWMILRPAAQTSFCYGPCLTNPFLQMQVGPLQGRKKRILSGSLQKLSFGDIQVTTLSVKSPMICVSENEGQSDFGDVFPVLDLQLTLVFCDVHLCRGQQQAEEGSIWRP